MNQQAFQAGKSAYQKGDWAGCVAMLAAAKDPGEVSGAVDHLRGNSLMKLGRFAEAADAYSSALRDVSYGKSGALKTNRGRAYLAAGLAQEAVASLTEAANDPTYATPYKASMALGNAHLTLGNVREAGVAFRNAAIDETNPDPSSALTSLGGCFMEMGRPADAVEAYRTALDFSTPLANQDAIYAELGMAYLAANAPGEAVDSFNHAVASGSYQLSAEQQASFEAARKALSAIKATRTSDTDAMLAAAGYGSLSNSGSMDPLDPLGKSGEFIPSPEDTGFFSIDEHQIVQEDKKNRKVRRKHRHTGLKVFLAILFILIILGAVAGYAYYRGYGWPTQEAVISEMFDSVGTDEGISGSLASGVTDELRESIESILPEGATIKVEGIDQNMTSSTAVVRATLPDGGSQLYEITLTRDGLSWKVTGVEVKYQSQGGEDPVVDESSTMTVSGTVVSEGSSASDAPSASDATAQDEESTDSDTSADEQVDEEVSEDEAE